VVWRGKEMKIELSIEEVLMVKDALEKSIYPSCYFSIVELAQVRRLLKKFGDA
jgi:hypothetical protein